MQKTIWKAHKVMMVMYKSRGVQKPIWKGHKVLGIMYNPERYRKPYGRPQGNLGDVIWNLD